MPQRSTMTEAEYLAFERESDIRHEYLHGQVFAMAGASDNHNAISGSLNFLLYGQLRERPCRVYVESMRVPVAASGLYTYPDVAVTCEKPRFADDEFDTLLNPQIIMEILSPSTERYDRGEKFQQYRQLTSLREYVLVAQDRPYIEHYLHDGHGAWTLTDINALDAALALPTIKCELKLAEIYKRVTFNTPSS